MFEEATEDNCNENCQRYHYCAQYYQDYHQFEDCVMKSEKNLGQTLGLNVIILVPLALLISIL